MSHKLVSLYIGDGEYYTRTDADAVIAELKAQVNGFFNRANLWHYNAQNEHNAAVAVRMENAKLKHQVDEKDKEIAKLKETLNNSRNARKYWRKEYLIEYKECCSQKYKRCLAMARMCEERSARYDVLQERHDLDWGREIEFYFRWYKRWLELAKKFKEAK